jgi:hypothetical protein
VVTGALEFDAVELLVASLQNCLGQARSFEIGHAALVDSLTNLALSARIAMTPAVSTQESGAVRFSRTKAQAE